MQMSTIDLEDYQKRVKKVKNEIGDQLLILHIENKETQNEAKIIEKVQGYIQEIEK